MEKKKYKLLKDIVSPLRVHIAGEVYDKETWLKMMDYEGNDLFEKTDWFQEIPAEPEMPNEIVSGFQLMEMYEEESLKLYPDNNGKGTDTYPNVWLNLFERLKPYLQARGEAKE